MRTIGVSTEVFAAIWAARRDGEETEDAILYRLLIGKPRIEPSVPRLSHGENTPEPRLEQGFRASMAGVHFPEGFEMHRTYKGQQYRLVATNGRLLLTNNGQRYDSLSEASYAIGAKIENVWKNWFFLDEDGARQPITVKRPPAAIHRRKRS